MTSITPKRMQSQKVGQPKIILDLVEMEKLAAMGCTLEEMADLLSISKQTIINHQKEDPELMRVIERGRARIKISVRRHQIKLMEDGNPTMAIWLGKQLLGQRDEQHLEHTGKDGGPITIAQYDAWLVEDDK